MLLYLFEAAKVNSLRLPEFRVSLCSESLAGLSVKVVRIFQRIAKSPVFF